MELIWGLLWIPISKVNLVTKGFRKHGSILFRISVARLERSDFQILLQAKCVYIWSRWNLYLRKILARFLHFCELRKGKADSISLMRDFKKPPTSEASDNIDIVKLSIWLWNWIGKKYSPHVDLFYQVFEIQIIIDLAYRFARSKQLLSCCCSLSTLKNSLRFVSLTLSRDWTW